MSHRSLGAVPDLFLFSGMIVVVTAIVVPVGVLTTRRRVRRRGSP